MIFYIPDELAPPTLRDMSSLAPETMPKHILKGYKDLSKYQFVKGQPMSEAELKKLSNAYPGFKPIGWKAINLGKMTATAFVAFAWDS